VTAKAGTVKRLRWDIFCRVIDNFGDVGVAWRLARALALEEGDTVRLWVDDPARLARICPGIDPALESQRHAGIEVRRWGDPFPAAEPGDVVVEMFQCETPASFVEAMAAQPAQPRWINLDYLSAETWVAGCHGLPSPHPRLPLVKHFFFPGFDADTGGLLMERGLFEARDAFLADRPGLAAWWRGFDLDLPGPDEIRVSLFCYDSAPVEALVDAWANGTVRITCLVPEGLVAARLLARRTHPAPGPWIERGRARLRVVPFTDQDRYDRLLWACDVNFVRGEDSFVRAQWAQHAFVWNIYPQGENTHWIKLNAFLDRHCEGLAPEPAAAMRDLWRAWNGIVRPAALADAWSRFLEHRRVLDRHAGVWASGVAAGGGLAAKLGRFCRQPL